MRTRPVAVVIWAVLLALAVVIVVRARYSASLAAFLPQAPSASERLLIDELRNGIASRLIILAIRGGTRSGRGRLSAALAARLRTDPAFATVENGSAAGARRDAAFLFAHRYLLSPEVRARAFTAAGLRAAIRRTLALVGTPGGLLGAPTLWRDPTGAMFALTNSLARLQPPRRADGVWVSRDGHAALLLLRTRAPGSATQAQAQAIARIRGTFRAVCAAQHIHAVLQMSGPGVFAVQARARIEQAVLRLSLASGALILTLLAWAYRSVLAVALGLVPVASGALAGIAAVALRFGVVQGVTLGFGVTLIGEAVDYSVYLFVQSQNRNTAADGAGWRRTAWPTVRLGMLTSVCGFAALLASRFPGLAQLGLYSLAGVLAAGAVTRFVLPRLLPAGFAVRDLRPLGRTAGRILRGGTSVRWALLALGVAAAAVLYLRREQLWDRNLAALSPVPAAAQRLDAHLRAALGAPPLGDVAVIRAPDEQAALRAAERADRALAALVTHGVISSYQSPALYLPSRALQRRRQRALPPPQILRQRLVRALRGLPLRPAELAPFVRAVAAARMTTPVGRKALAGTSFAAAVAGLLIRDRSGWQALLPLAPPPAGAIRLGRVRAALAPEHAVVLDLKQATNALYTTYLTEAVRLSLAGLGAIALLLAVALGSPRRMLRVMRPLLLAVLIVAAGLIGCGERLTLLNLIGLLLIVAVGSNYALFLERRSPDPALTLASLVLANGATVLGFGVLAFAAVPVLHQLGETVAPGAALALVFAALLRPDAVAAPAEG
jgi:predicted exporter